jgi:indolepyruvate ferredoxin oxidoreductase
VARLYKDPSFKRRLREEFDGDFRIKVNLAPQLLNARDPMSGRARKFELPFGVVEPAFTVLASLRRIRGTWLDVFGKTRHRRAERQRIDDYERLIVSLLDDLNDQNYGAAAQIASVPEMIRGYDSVKDQSAQRAIAAQQQYLDEFAKASRKEGRPSQTR